jgi:hypothetical protein
MQDGAPLSAIDARLQAPGPKRILALDGGGVKGILTAAMLEVVEARLKARIADEAAREAFRLSDYFDLIGGTSTGSIIAAWLALGRKASEVTALYRELCPEVFRSLVEWRGGLRVNFKVPVLQAKFEARHFKAVIERKLGEIAEAEGLAYQDVTMDTPLLKTGLAIFCKRADTGSPWIVTNNPRAMYWDGAAEPWRAHWADHYAKTPDAKPFPPNAKYLLGDVVRASAAAPTFLDAVNIEVDHGVTGRFVDGAVSTNNNPALALFLAATLRGGDLRSVDDARRTPYGFRWPAGPERVFLMSLGTGSRRAIVKKRRLSVGQHVEALRAVGVLQTVIQDTMNFGVVALQAMSAPTKPVEINSEVGDMAGLLVGDKPLLTFRRIDPKLEVPWLEREMPEGPPFKPSPLRRKPATWAGVSRRVEALDKLDRAGARHLELLRHIGAAYAAKAIDDDDFPAAFDVAGMAQTGSPDRPGPGEPSAEQVERIARAAHAALSGWRAATGQTPPPAWDEAEPWMRESTIASVRWRIANPSAPASAEHERWMKEKRDAGWTHGPVRDDAAKIHPMLVEYEQLSEDERRKDALIIAVIDALSRPA